MKILNFGSCNIDYVYGVNHIVTPGETETADCLSIYPGGKGLPRQYPTEMKWSQLFKHT